MSRSTRAVKTIFRIIFSAFSVKFSISAECRQKYKTLLGSMIFKKHTVDVFFSLDIVSQLILNKIRSNRIQVYDTPKINSINWPAF